MQMLHMTWSPFWLQLLLRTDDGALSTLPASPLCTLSGIEKPGGSVNLRWAFLRLLDGIVATITRSCWSACCRSLDEASAYVSSTSGKHVHLVFGLSRKFFGTKPYRLPIWWCCRCRSVTSGKAKPFTHSGSESGSATTKKLSLWIEHQHLRTPTFTVSIHAFIVEGLGGRRGGMVAPIIDERRKKYLPW